MTLEIFVSLVTQSLDIENQSTVIREKFIIYPIILIAARGQQLLLATIKAILLPKLLSSIHPSGEKLDEGGKDNEKSKGGWRKFSKKRSKRPVTIGTTNM